MSKFLILDFYQHLGEFKSHLFIAFNPLIQGPQMFRPVFSKFTVFVVPNISYNISKTCHFVEITKICL